MRCVASDEKTRACEVLQKRQIQGKGLVATVQSMKSSAEAGSFTFQDGAQRPVSLPVSFKGFAPALDASLKP